MSFCRRVRTLVIGIKLHHVLAYSTRIHARNTLANWTLAYLGSTWLLSPWGENENWLQTEDFGESASKVVVVLREGRVLVINASI